MTIRRIRHQRVHRAIIRRDHQLTVMLIVQVLCTVILSLQVAIQKLYAEFTLNQNKSPERIQIETFVATLAVYLTLTNSATSFYLFSLTSRVFRKELKYLLFCSNRRQVGIGPIPIMAQARQNKNEHRKVETAP
jgi:hypothetical protein